MINKLKLLIFKTTERMIMGMTDRHTDRSNGQTDTQIDKWTDRHTDRSVGKLLCNCSLISYSPGKKIANLTFKLPIITNLCYSLLCGKEKKMEGAEEIIIPLTHAPHKGKGQSIRVKAWKCQCIYCETSSPSCCEILWLCASEMPKTTASRTCY